MPVDDCAAGPTESSCILWFLTNWFEVVESVLPHAPELEYCYGAGCVSAEVGW